ncbi:MAG: beta-propeller domain-containing protein, partial [Bradymonadaceae bacterium]
MRTPRRSEKAGFDVAGLSALLVAAFLFGVGGCSGVDSDADTAATDPQPTPKPGESSFATAGARDGAETPENEQAEAGAGGRRGSFAAPSKRGRKRSIEEGDVYEVVRHSDQILNLNRYRGLQVVDFSDPRHPSVIGRARLHGDPVEMYLVGNKVYALLNDWQGYRPRASHFLPRRVSGSVVAVVDISDPTDPSVVETKRLSGEIRTSRLTRGRGREALFVVSEAHSEQGQRTKVRSFSVSGRGELKRASMLDLGGDVTDVRGIDNRLLVARRSDDRNDDASRVAVVDISDPSGRMVMGGDVRVPGRVQNEHNMHVHGDVLRVVSGSTRGDEPLNHLQTFDISNIHDPSPVDHVSFAEDERLEATLFMADRAFVVTFQRTDPFHAIAIGPRGGLDLKSEFIVSGWNDYFVPVADGQRLVGIGVDNADGGRTMAVSLYDAVDLKNPEPMIDREKVQLDYSRSEANRDDRAFTVLRDATSVKTADGTVETGLVLLPFRGWDHDRDEYRAGVQVFTFSKNTLTPRGVMEHGSKVRRSFAADRRHDVTGNISRSELSLYDTSDPNSPVETGRVELSPSYVRYWQFGEHAVRRDGQRRSPRAYRRRRKSEGTDRLEIVPASEHPD